MIAPTSGRRQMNGNDNGNKEKRFGKLHRVTNSTDGRLCCLDGIDDSLENNRVPTVTCDPSSCGH